MPTGGKSVLHGDDSTIHIVFGTDENYIPHMGMAMTSILMNSSLEEDIHFHVLAETFPEKQKTKIAGLKTSIRDFRIFVLEGCESSDFDYIDRLGDGSM